MTVIFSTGWLRTSGWIYRDQVTGAGWSYRFWTGTENSIDGDMP